MKTHHSLIQGCCLVAALLLSSSMGWAGTLNRGAFKARRQTNLVRQVNSSVLTHSDTLSLRGMGAVYALSIDATIQQPREASFVRIVLEDTKGHDYLVAESDRFRNDTSTVQLSEYCEETAQLAGITPSLLKCYVTGDATLQITGIHASNQESMRLLSTSEETDAAIKKAQVQDIVDRINEYNIRHGKLWRAGLNNWALAESGSGYNGEEDAYTADFKYYAYGFYEMGERPAIRDVPVSNPTFVDSFDWRNRHGKNWITSVKDQGPTTWCAMFAAIGLTESYVNLYYNNPSIDLDLSEQDIISYGPDAIRTLNYELAHVLSHINSGVIDESSLQFTGNWNAPTEPRPVGEECVALSFGTPDFWPGNTKQDIDNTLRYNIINYGPGILGYLYSNVEYIYNKPYSNHFMTLVGYGTVTQQDVDSLFTFVDVSTMGTTMAGNETIGQIYYILKDSYGSASDSIYHHDGYRYIIFYDYSKIREKAFALQFLSRRGHTDAEILVEDKDGDGYFNWGIGLRPDDRLPVWAAQKEDADDSNDTIGCYSDLYGHTKALIYGWNSYDDYFYGTNGVIDSSIVFIRGAYEIARNANVTITGNLIFHPLSTFFLGRNSTVIIDGGIIVDPSFEFESNTKVILKNGGKIYFTKRKPNFTFPLGVSLEIQSGEINYIRDYSIFMP